MTQALLALCAMATLHTTGRQGCLGATPWIVPEPPPADDVASGRGPAAAPTMGGAAAAALPMANGCAAHYTRQGV
jgi:hypothetical protein